MSEGETGGINSSNNGNDDKKGNEQSILPRRPPKQRESSMMKKRKKKERRYYNVSVHKLAGSFEKQFFGAITDGIVPKEEISPTLF